MATDYGMHSGQSPALLRAGEIHAMIGRTREVIGVSVPSFIYGTAWKEERTFDLVRHALSAGFRGIDTANQRRHYWEAEVGRAVKGEVAAGTLRRQDLFLQTKFTFLPSQDHRLPYDPGAPIERQVEQSFESSLTHLGVERPDSYLLHGPSQRSGLGRPDIAAWRAMEALQQGGRVPLIGVSNFFPNQLQELLRIAKVPPAFVQNRCYALLGWDADVRAVCESEGIVYQAFSLLTANVQFLRSAALHDIARRHGRTSSQVVFRFALDMGMIPLTGTTNPTHMADDLAVFDFELNPQETMTIERIAA